MQKKTLVGIASGLVLHSVSAAVAGGLENIKIPSNLVTIPSGISNRHSRTKNDTINENVYTANQSTIRISEQLTTMQYINLGMYALLGVTLVAYANQVFENLNNRHQLRSYKQKKH